MRVPKHFGSDKSRNEFSLSLLTEICNNSPKLLLALFCEEDRVGSITLQTDKQAGPGHDIRWARVVLAAFLLEVVLFVVLVPIGQVFGNTVFLIAVPIGCIVFGFLFGMWVVRPLRSGFLLHGSLVGILATILYLGLCAMGPGGIPAAAAVYGTVFFLVLNAVKIGACVAGSIAKGRGAAA